MLKRRLKDIPIPQADNKRIHEIAITNANIRGVIAVQNCNVDDNDTLVLNVYQVSGKNRNDISLQFRVFCQKEDYITLEVDNGKWRTGALLNLTCRGSGYPEIWWGYSQLEFLTNQDAYTAKTVFEEWTDDNRHNGRNRAFDFLNLYQSQIMATRLAKKHKKITDIIDADMEKFGAIPNDYQSFVEEKVFKYGNYIFYNTKRKRAFCTSCKMSFVLEDKHLRHETIGVWNKEDEVRHNRTVRCPYCNKYLTAKSEGMSRDSLALVRWSVLVQKNGDEVLTRYFRHIKDFRVDFHNPTISTYEGFRTVHSADKSTDYMWARFMQTEKTRWCYYRERRYSCYAPGEMVEPRSMVVMYNTSLQDAVKGTCMKYSVPDIFIEHVANEDDGRYFKNPWLIDNYFNEYRKYPFIEQLLKVGFYRLTRDFIESFHGSRTQLYSGCNSVLGTLGINKYQFNMLRKVDNPRMRDLEILRYKPDLKWEDFIKLRYVQDNGYSDMYKKYIDFMKYTTIHKLCRYLTEQKIIHSHDYFDYTKWLEEMGYDMRNDYNLFPKDFIKAHDEMSKQYMKYKDKQAREDTKRFNMLLKKLRKDTSDVDAMNLNIQGLFIRLPNKLDELKKEGEALHHCVGTYMEKVRRGETMIFFIRKKAEPDKSFYTLEWKGKVVQCRGYQNCDMTPEVRTFVEIFQEKMTEYENAPKEKRKVG